MLLAVLVGIALIVVVLLPAELPDPIDSELPAPAIEEAPAEIAEVDSASAPNVTGPASDRVETQATAPVNEPSDASFGSFPVLVLDIDGSPAVGIVVRSSRGDPVMGWERLMYSSRTTSTERRTDDQGRVDLPYPDPGPQPVLIGARKHGASAMQRRERTAISVDDPWVLQLESVPSMLVRLVDPSGQPVVGQEVCWWADPQRRDRTLFELESDARGEAHFDDLPRLARNANLLGSAFGLQGVFVERPIRIVQEFERASGEIELQVPATGSMKFTIRYADDAPLGDHMLTALCFALGQEEAHSEFFRWQRSDGQNVHLDEGIAFYPVVEIAQLWQFAVLPRFFGTPIASQQIGPRTAGEQVEIEIVLAPDPMARHTLRVLDTDGNPLAKTALRTDVGMAGKGGSSQTGSGGTTDEDGYLTLELPSAPNAETWTLQLSSNETGSALQWSGNGTTDGQSHDMPHEVHLQEIPRIVSGQAVFADGSPIENWVQFNLGIRARDSNEVQGIGSFTNVAKQVGTFDLRSENLPSGQLVLSARLGEVTRWTDLNVALGQENVTIVLPAVGTFSVHAGDNEAKLFAQLTLELMLPELDPKTAAKQDLFSSQASERGDSFRLTRLPIAEDHAQTSPLMALAGPMQWVAKDRFERLLFHQAFDLRAGSTREDPHIATLPKLALRMHTLRVRAASGEVLPRAYASFPTPNGSRSGYSIRNGIIEFVSVELPPAFTIRADGYVEQTVNWTGPELEVVLQPEP